MRWSRSIRRCGGHGVEADAALGVGDLADLPSFNWDGPVSWPVRRRLLNRLSPLLFIPYLPAVFIVSFMRERSYYGLRENLRMALGQAIYGGMVQFYVARYLYLGLPVDTGGAAAERPRPSGGGHGGA